MQSRRIPMPLNALRSFEAAARLGSFNAAADELGVTPSAISMQIRRLEEMVGRALFVRGHRSVTLSEMGERLAPGLSEHFSGMEQLLAEQLARESTLLRVSSMPSFAHQWLAPRLGKFTGAHPRYQVRVAGEDRLVHFDSEEVDVGIRYGPGDYEGLQSELIARAEAFPVCSPAFAKAHQSQLASVARLAELPLLDDEIGRQAAGLPTWQAWFEAAGVRPVTNLSNSRFESLHMALIAASRGQGIALGLTPLVDDDLAAGRLVRLFDIAIPSRYSFWLVCKPERAREHKIAAFRRWIADEIRAA